MRLYHNRSAAFTLVEIMIVVAIIGLLASIAIPAFMKARTQSQASACINNLRQMDAAKEMAAFENGWSSLDGPGTIGNPLYYNTCSTYIKGGLRPICPTGANCYYNALTEAVSCQSGIADHVLQ
jgi:prepilin-type N-terminal cleavage/methylation domain-containing protein